MPTHESTDVRCVLERFSFYRDASPVLRQEILAAGEPVRLAPGAVFYREGDRCPCVALVGRGNIRVFKTSDTAQEITLYHVQDEDVCLVNMLAVVLELPAMASAIIEAPTDAVLLPAARFRQWLDTADSVRRFAFESMATRVIDVMVLVESLAFRRTDQRLARLLLDRFASDPRANPVIAKTHEDLARELGTAREVVSRLIKEFERLGAISGGRGRIELVDPSVLTRFLEGR